MKDNKGNFVGFLFDTHILPMPDRVLPHYTGNYRVIKIDGDLRMSGEEAIIPVVVEKV